MKQFSLMVAWTAALAIAGYATAGLLRDGITASQASADPPQTTPLDAKASYEAARQLAWQAAVSVQNPPHEIATWQKARVNWRKAMRLLESIPPDSAQAAAAKQRLSVYRRNYQAIGDRLTTEQTAAANLETAQEKAWQAAFMVQNPPHSLRLWQRASQKWQEGIQMLEAAPANSAKALEIQRKLQLYRQNRAMIQQRIATETQALKVLEEFVAVGARLKTLADRALMRATLDPVGLSEPEYAKQVSTLEQSLAQLAQQVQGKAHPIYAELAATLEDYKLALKLWRRYIAEQQNDPDWSSTYEMVSQRVSLSLDDSRLLAQKYNVKPSPGSAKVSLRFTVWDIWQQGGDRIRRAQRHALGQPIAETSPTPP
jgi:hypothetical protein